MKKAAFIICFVVIAVVLLLIGFLKAWGLSTATYDNKNISSSPVTNPGSVFFNATGTKMFVLGRTGTVGVYQFTLSTPWDVSTATYDNKNISTSAQDSGAMGFFFKSDGTKLYVAARTGDRVYQYSLKAWDVSTATYDNVNFSVATQDNNPHSMFIDSSGTRMYILGRQNNFIYQYTLSTAWNVSTATYTNTKFDTDVQDANPSGHFFKTDGTKLYVTTYTDPDKIFQYSLSTAWNVSTATYDNVNVTVYPTVHDANGFFIRSDGAKMYLPGSYSAKIYQYSMAAADTCTCPGLNQNWAIAMSDYCNITTDCNLGTGKLSFTGSSWCKCNATVTTTNLGDPRANNFLYIQNSCTIYVKG